MNFKLLLTTLRTTCFVAIVSVGAWTAAALPPTGLTQIRTTPDSTADLAVIDGVAYASSNDGIYVIDSDGVDSHVVPINPSLPSLIDTTRVVQADDGDVYFWANFANAGTTSGAGRSIMLFNMNDDSTPIATINGAGYLRGMDNSLRGLVRNLSGVPYEMFPDGTTSVLTVGPEADGFFPSDLTPNGTAVGDAVFAGTLGSGPALLLPNGDVEFIGLNGGDADIRDRADANGVNASYVDFYHSVVYGDSPTIDIDSSIGVSADFTGKVQVSETEFAVVEVYDGSGPPDEFDEFRIYYPGVNPAGMDLSVSLFDIFPELNALDFNRVLDIASSEGQIHMLLSGDDGLWLFAAPDPSLIPEPSALALYGLLFALGAKRLARRAPSLST